MGDQRQEDCSFESSLGYRMIPCLKKSKSKTKQKKRNLHSLLRENILFSPDRGDCTVIIEQIFTE
jgi:hypothetical protein